MNSDPIPTATHLLFVYAYHNLPGISEGEWLEYYDPHSLAGLRRDLKDYVQHQLDLFSGCSDYEDDFSQAEYPDLQESISDDEVALFRSALRPVDRDPPLEELHPRDQLNGLRAVILQRVDDGKVDHIRTALRLFDGIMESGIPADEMRNPRSYIRIETASEFVPWFIDSLLQSVDCLKQKWGIDPYRRFVGEQFEYLKLLLEMLRLTVHREGWPQSDLALGRFLLVVDYFKHVVEEGWGT